MDVSQEILKYIHFNNGFYIECGANDGVCQSNTYILEKQYGWKGILVEPSKNKFLSCVENRSNSNIFVNCALVSTEYKGTTVKGDFDGNLMSSVGGKRRGNVTLIEVPARTLTSILKENKVENVNFFSLDVEGYEYEVLQGLDLDTYKPDYVLIETYIADLGKIIEHMRSFGYISVCNLSNFNKKEHPNWDGTHNDYLFKR